MWICNLGFGTRFNWLVSYMFYLLLVEPKFHVVVLDLFI